MKSLMIKFEDIDVSKFKIPINDCDKCHITFKMPYEVCCLYECGEHSFCDGCNKGIYLKGE